MAQNHGARVKDGLDKFAVLLLDDFGYGKKSEQETQVLFELIAHLYEGTCLRISVQFRRLKLSTTPAEPNEDH